MGDQYIEQQFQSKNDPGYFIKKYIWLSDMNNSEKYPVDLQGDPMPPYFEEKTEVFTIKSKMTSAQIKKDRRQRATKHFKQEIYPTLAKGSDEQKHHAKKHNLKT